MTLNTIAHLLILISMPFVIGYSAVLIVIGVHRQMRPWRVGMKAWGGAVVLTGYVSYNFVNPVSHLTLFSMALVTIGLGLILLPSLWDMAKNWHDETNL